MPTETPPAPSSTPMPGHAVQVFAAGDVIATMGANQGDGLGRPEELCPGDIYALVPRAQPRRLVLEQGATGRVLQIAQGSAIGAAGEAIRLIARCTLLSGEGAQVDLLVLEHDRTAEVYLLPLSPLAHRTGYSLVGIDTDPAPAPVVDLICVSFARGTRITLPTGLAVPIETLAPGDRVLTRDHGPQPVRWLGRATLRAEGSLAPVVISAGTLGNEGDLIVSPHHRIFLYQRARTPRLATAEVLVQAKHLVDGGAIFQREGGRVDWFSLVFDQHEIIYAEGIPCESLQVSEATVARLPPDLAEQIHARFPGLRQSQHFGTEAGREALDDLRGPGRR